MFVDEAVIEVRGGDGGDGVVAFRREKYVPLGGPSGGDGGKGGDVVLQADPHRKTLLDLSRHRHHKGGRGMHGEGGRRHGSDGAGIVLQVPPGTQITDARTGETLADLIEPGQSFIAAHGGQGGRGNPHFTGPAHQAPRFAEKGEPGQERRLRLSLKLLADVALIGLPNAGKSTLIAAISAARPKIAAYPFTTLVPSLGMVRLNTENQFVVADIPGLIRGAHRGSGLGHQFLRHVERSPVLVHLIDPLAPGVASPWRNFLTLNRELRLWKPELLERPQIVALTKMDTVGEAESARVVQPLQERLEQRGYEVFPISAATGQGLQPLLWKIMDLVRETRARVESGMLPPLEVTRLPADLPLVIKEIARYADGRSEWEVEGGLLGRLVTRFDMDNPEAVFYLHRRLQRDGTLEELRRAGIKVGDWVHVSDAAFEFQD